MRDFLIDLLISASLFFPLFLLVFFLLWRLKDKGFYTVLLGFFFEALFLWLGFAIAPYVMQYHHGLGGSPIEQGIEWGCGMPMVFMSVYHLAQRQKKQTKKETVTKS